MYCHIIGFPLNKPRSVKIWRNFFKKKKKKITMTAKEIPPSQLKNFFSKIKSDKLFKATAITMPYKEKVINFIKYGNIISRQAKSINLIIKNKNSLIGFNTDVEGAMQTVKLVKKKNIMIYGIGGTGKSILRVFLNKYKKSNFQLISSKRNLEFTKKKNVNSSKIIVNEKLKDIDLFINCSPLGSDLKKKFKKNSPLSENQVKMLKNSCVVFDIVYSPSLTLLGKYCKKNDIKFLNGLKMNTIQANNALNRILKF